MADSEVTIETNVAPSASSGCSSSSHGRRGTITGALLPSGRWPVTLKTEAFPVPERADGETDGPGEVDAGTSGAEKVVSVKPGNLVVRGTSGEDTECQTEYEVLRGMEHLPACDEGMLAARDHLVSALLASAGRHGDAVAMLRDTRTASKRNFGEQHVNTLAATMALSRTLDGLGQHNTSEPLHREVLDAEQRALGKEHASTLIAASNLANALGRTGNHAEAEALHRQTLEARHRALGEDHPATMMTSTKLAATLGELGKGIECEALYRETLAVQQRVLGDAHPLTRRTAELLEVAMEHQFDW